LCNNLPSINNFKIGITMATSKGSDGGRYGGYGQSGYEEEAADEPGVQADFDEEENREAGEGDISRKVGKAPRKNAKKSTD
jgi:hypothetical protein